MLPSDRRRHVYIIGKTGMGKSTLLENMIYDDIMNNRLDEGWLKDLEGKDNIFPNVDHEVF